MKAGPASRVSTLKELCRFAKAIERRGGKPFTQPELATELGISTRTVTRFLQTFREELGLEIETSTSRSGTTVKDKWKFLEAMADYYKRGA
jgi:biotin operon repressor